MVSPMACVLAAPSNTYVAEKLGVKLSLFVFVVLFLSADGRAVSIRETHQNRLVSVSAFACSVGWASVAQVRYHGTNGWAAGRVERH